MARKSALEIEVENFNEKYCKNSENKLALHRAYGGVQVILTGKNSKGGLRTSAVSITNGYNTPQKALQNLYKEDSKGWLEEKINFYNRNRF